jgi:hypothetical protein
MHTYIYTYVEYIHRYTHTHTCPLVLSINLQTVVVTICTTDCNIKKFCMLSVHCISDYHSKYQLLLHAALTNFSLPFCEIPLYTVELLRMP